MRLNKEVSLALEALSDRVSEDKGCKVMSCLFITLMSETAVMGEIDKKEQVKAHIVGHIPEGLDNPLHDLTMLQALINYSHDQQTRRLSEGQESHED